MLVVEDLTLCEVCGSAEQEESMLLCDRCDLGFHLHCLSPPLARVPPDEWLCPACRELPADAIHLSEVEDLLDEVFGSGGAPSGPRPSPLRLPRAARRSARRPAALDQPSTSGRARPAAAPAARRRTAPRRKYKRRRTKTVVIEYEVQSDGKFPITRTVTRKVKRKVKRRRPRTAARREHVRASVRARLAAHGARPAAPALPAAALARPLSLFGNPNELDYFSDEPDAPSEQAAIAVALRPAASALSAHRQARRKLLGAPSPPHASAAPDLLADILRSQTLLHARPRPLDAARAAVRQAPAHGQRAGGWGGGYRGPYRRDQTADFSRAGGHGAGPPRADHGPPAGFARAAERDEPPPFDAFPRRPRPPDEPPARRPPPARAGPAHRPLAEPPVFGFPKLADVDKSEDEKSDPGLVIDTDKYDPTEPTRDDDSGDDDTPAAPPPAPPPPPTPPPPPPAVRVALAGGLLDTAVRQVLREHRSALAPGAHAASDDESDGDCPNFSIYSAASVHIANSSSALMDHEPLAEPAPAPAPAPAAPAAERRRSEDEYMEKVSKRCPITADKRTPIKIKLNTPTLIKRRVSLYDDGDASPDAADADAVEAHDDAAPADDAAAGSASPAAATAGGCAEPLDGGGSDETLHASVDGPALDVLVEKRNGDPAAPPSPPAQEPAAPPTPPAPEPAEPPSPLSQEQEPAAPAAAQLEPRENGDDDLSHHDEEEDSDEKSDASLGGDATPREPPAAERPDDVEKMTESISETEDERSYTPCLDENRSAADGPADAADDGALAGLDTELISEDEGHELFSRAASPAPPARAKDGKRPDAVKKKKKKESKREGKDKAKGKKKGDVAFKKLSKSGKERNYRERSRDERLDERRASPAARRRRKDKRKDLERYDVRTVVSEKRRRQKDAFGRDVSPQRSPSPSPSPPRRSPSAFRSPEPPEPARVRRSPSASRGRRSPSPPSRVRRSPSPLRLRRSPSPLRARRSPSPQRARRSLSPQRARRSPARRRSATPPPSPRRRKRRRSASAERSPPRRAPKKKKRARAARRPPPSPARKRRRSASPPAPPSPASRPPSPRTPPPEPAPEPRRRAGRRAREPAGPSKEVFTSGDNILVSVSFKEQERGAEGERRRRRDARRERRRRRRRAAPEDAAAKPVAIIDLERSPFRELTPSPENVIVLSDSDAPAAPEPAAPAPPPEPPAGPKTPPSPAAPAPAPPPAPAPAPDAYDPFEPTRSPTPPPPEHMTLEAAQRSNLSADDVLARRPLTPVEKVMALLASTREAQAVAEAEAEAEAPPAPRIVLPSPTRAPPKLFPGKPSPIKSNPVKPMQATRLARDAGASPYSPGSSDFGELFEPPPRRAPRQRRPPDDKLLDELPGSAVELQVKSKLLKKLNRQERVVEEVKLVLKPHYNKKRVSKEEYKDILRRAVPKICHNKSGEINPTKIQALVEAYVKKFRKKHKMAAA